MQQKRLDQYEVLLFDVYGTLIDWNSGVYEAFKPLLERANSSWTKDEALAAFNSIEVDKIMQHPGTLYIDILETAYDALAQGLGVETPDEENALFASSIAKWKPFTDTAAALAKLKKYYKLVVLSNVDNASFLTFTRPLLEVDGGTFDLIVTAQDIGSYKPSLENFEAALHAINSKFGIPKEKVLVTAHGLTSDHEPANALGIASSWIERGGAVTHSSSIATYYFSFETLGDMANAREALESTNK